MSYRAMKGTTKTNVLNTKKKKYALKSRKRHRGCAVRWTECLCPPKFLCRSPSPCHVVFGDGPLGVVGVTWGHAGAPPAGISALLREMPNSLVALYLPHEDTTRRQWSTSQGKSSHQKPSAIDLALGPPSLRNCVFEPPAVMFGHGGPG